MELSREDALRLNVLLAGELHAIRIDESVMTVHGLSERGEAQIKLNPCGRADRYLRLVRETISGQVLGSPGGYPVYLKRWTRMGQARDESLTQLLKLGEPEAVSAVVHAPGLTEALARRAWWAMPSAENARSMLRREAVVNSSLGPVLAEYLVDYLPFETEPSAGVETVRLILQQPPLISPEVRQGIWSKAKHKTSYQVGFMLACPDVIPERRPPRSRVQQSAARLKPLLVAPNAFAQQLMRVWSASGQSFLHAAEQVLRRPADQDVVLLLFQAIADYFRPARIDDRPEADMETLIMEAGRLCAADSDANSEQQVALKRALQCCPECQPDLEGMLVLARLGYPAARPVFSRTTAIGGLMRRKLEPVTRHLFGYLRQLQGQDGS
jgi:hypothetical protein